MTFHTVTSILIGLGGLSIFLYGMILLSEGLRAASGDRFQGWMTSISGSRWRGFMMGLGMGTAVHSTASTVMAVGLINAGLLTLSGALPLIAGANVGTTVAMQLVAFDISWLWAALALLGILFRMGSPGTRRGRVGQALIGIALLFLGMRLMSQSVLPFREELASWIAHHGGHDWPTFMLSFAAAILFTALIQSSGVTIGILFALSTAGVITDIRQAFPLIIGAQIGTCITALLSSFGTAAEARRGALAHLLFNLMTAGLSIALMPFLLKAVDIPGISLNRQIAVVHTLSMLAGSALIVPLAGPFIRLLRALTPFRADTREQTFLDQRLLDNPEAALLACRSELGRITRIIRKGFALNRELMKQPSARTYALVKQTELDVDNIYRTSRRYLMRLTASVHDSMSAARIQWLNLCLIYLERISDHNDNLADLSMEIVHHMRPDDLAYTRGVCESLYAGVAPVLDSVQQAWIHVETDAGIHAETIRTHRAAYLPESEQHQSDVVDNIARGHIESLTGFMLTEYISEMDRIVRHAKKIAGVIRKGNQPIH